MFLKAITKLSNGQPGNSDEDLSITMRYKYEITMF